MKDKSLLLQLLNEMQPEDMCKEISWFGHSENKEQLYDGKTGCICGWVAIKTGLNPNDLSSSLQRHWEDKFGESFYDSKLGNDLGIIHQQYARNKISFEEMKKQAIKLVEEAN